MGCYGKIFLYTVKKYNSDWLNKKLNGQELGRIGGGRKNAGKEKAGPRGDTEEV